MDERHARVIAKKIASILAENEATVFDIKKEFKYVKMRLKVTYEKPRLYLGQMIIPDDLPHD